MKKIAIVAITILAMLFSILPNSAALAKKDDTNVTIKVRNRTGGKVFLTLIDENGNRQFLEFAPGVTNSAQFEGQYSYYATTQCGNQSGEFNLNVTKQLSFSCGDGIEIALTVPVGQHCYSVFDYDLHNVWGLIGTYCQPDKANVGEWVPFYNPYFQDTLPHYYLPDGHECYQGGKGYYFPCFSVPS